MKPKCPHCGQTVQRPHGLDLPPLEADLFNIMFDAYPAAIRCSVVVDLLYGMRHDGGPLWARGAMSQIKHKLCLKLAPHGWTIGSFGNQKSPQGTTYRLMRIDEGLTRRQERA